jgi:hypothetical protein
MTRLFVTALLWLLASPVFLVIGLRRALKRCRFWAMAYRPSILCRSCSAAISLLGMWECHCGYTYRGHLLRACPVCHSVPSMVRCYSCGTTEKLPEP